MTTTVREKLTTTSTAAATSGHDFDAEVVVPAAEELDRDQISKLVGAKNVMGTCSG